MIRNYKLKVKVPISVTWSQELVEDDDNFYMRLTPHINRSGKKGSPSITRTQSESGVSRIVLTTAYNELMKKIKADKELKDRIKKAVAGHRSFEPKPVMIQEAKTRKSTYTSLNETFFDDVFEQENKLTQEDRDRMALERLKTENSAEKKQLLHGEKLKLEDI